MLQFSETYNKNQSPIMQPFSYCMDEALKPDLLNDSADFKSIPILNDNESLAHGTTGRAFLFMDGDEKLHIATPELFCKKLKCGENDKIKVISIFGNTGDGKSHTMNNVFFHGDQVFKTSPEQNSCTLGVYAAMQSELGVLCLDTEGLLGTTAKSNRRMRMLLKILAISDIVIYRTRSERLHSDMYEFLGTASKAFCLHFSQALHSMGHGSILGPSVIIFHETRFTKPLESSVEESAEDKLRDSFNRLHYETNAFSSLRYIGTQTAADKITNFSKIIAAVRMEIENTAVRSPRQPSVIFRAMRLLNQKFAGEIIEKAINPFPEQYFSCPVHCESCSQRCQRSMGHESDGERHLNNKPCNYQHQFENRVLMCRHCYNNGKECIVNMRMQTQTESSWFSNMAQYAWRGAVIECPVCGEIYRSRQHWYGNKPPEAESVRPQIVHVWKGDDLTNKGASHSAQMVVDSVSYFSDAISSISAPSAKALTGWVADKVAPSYWKPNSELILCHACKRDFDKTGLPRHHCRGCGEGFCHACSQHQMPVPARGWQTPVRVCNDCYQQLQNKIDSKTENSSKTQAKASLNSCKYNPNITGSRPLNDEGDILVRKYGETIYNTISSVASVAFEYPKEIIKDSARPAYWIPDALSPACFICKMNFGTAEELETIAYQTKKLSLNTDSSSSSLNGASGGIAAGVVSNRNMDSVSSDGIVGNGNGNKIGDNRRHHCRRCGQAVCAACSMARVPVLERGWQTDVRVCDTCVLTSMTASPIQQSDINAAIASAMHDSFECDEEAVDRNVNNASRPEEVINVRATGNEGGVCVDENINDKIKPKKKSHKLVKNTQQLEQQQQHQAQQQRSNEINNKKRQCSSSTASYHSVDDNNSGDETLNGSSFRHKTIEAKKKV